jgi:hypothetical protein
MALGSGSNAEDKTLPPRGEGRLLDLAGMLRIYLGGLEKERERP